MKKIDLDVVLAIVGILATLLGIILDSSWLFLAGFIWLCVLLTLDSIYSVWKCTKTPDVKEDSDSSESDEPVDYEKEDVLPPTEDYDYEKEDVLPIAGDYDYDYDYEEKVKVDVKGDNKPDNGWYNND